MASVTVAEVWSQEGFSVLRQLIVEYADSLHFDLCFQHFEEELAHLHDVYGPPDGRALLAWQGGEPAGCVALRRIHPQICEMKRLYVRPVFRRKGLGKQMAESIIEIARRLGYEKIQLDTLASMKEAIALYSSLGFRRIEPYYNNPNERTIYMELLFSKANGGAVN